MASRRSRIKGIANIPQRRKNLNEPIILQQENDKMCLQTTGIKSEYISNLINEKTNATEPCITNYLVNDDNKISKTKILNDTNKELLQLNLGPEIMSKEDLICTESRIMYTMENGLHEVKPQIQRKYTKPILNITSKKTKVSNENNQEITSTTPAIPDSNQTTQTVKVGIVDNVKTVQDYEDSFSNNDVNEIFSNKTIVNINNETEITLNEINLATIQSNLAYKIQL